MQSDGPALDPPPVVAVVVTGGEHPERLEALLAALAEQDYPRLTVMVIESGGADVGARVDALLPGARLERAPGDRGFGAAANRVLDPALAPALAAEFLVLCHDDVVPDRGAVAALVAAAADWDADVVGPKYVADDDARRLLHVGLAVDRVGATLSFVEPGERDQGQHDGVWEVFVVPAGFTLVRRARFAEIGGFDEAVASLGDDLVLCWRARAAGARVLVTSDARVRHAESRSASIDAAPRERLEARHRLRAVLTCSSRLGLLWVLPLALGLSLVQALGGLVTGRPGRARAALGAWLWNLARPGSLWRARRRVNAVRRARDRDIRRMQLRGLVGPRLRLRRMRSAGATDAGGDSADLGGPGHGDAASGLDAAIELAGPGPAVPAGRRRAAVAPWTPGTGLVATVLAGVLLFGSRHLMTRFVPAVGELVAFPGDAGDLVRQWSSGYRSVGLGSDTAPPGLVGVAGALGAVLGGHLALARTLLTIGLLPVGVAGAYRLLRPARSKPAQVAAAVAYAAVPLPYDGLATGRWSVVAAYAAAPWMLGRLAGASGTAPFSRPAEPGAPSGVPSPAAQRPWWHHVVATGAVTALAGLLVPQAPALLVLAGVALALGTLAAFELRGAGRMLGAALAGAVVAALLQLPALVDLARSRSALEAWLGLEWPPGSLTAPDLLRFETGPFGVAPLGFCLAGAAALPLLVGRSWRLGWAVRGWVLAVACWALVWTQQEGYLTLRLPAPGVVLAPGAAGLALAIGLGVAAIELDVRGRAWRFGFRRTVSALGLLGLGAATVPVVVASMDGWWGMPTGGFDGVLGAVEPDVTGELSRVLWVGDPLVLPGGSGWPVGDGLSYSAVSATTPGVADLWPATGVGASDRIGEALALAADGQTSRLGRLLAPMGVEYVAVPRALAPSSALGGEAGVGGGAGEAGEGGGPVGEGPGSAAGAAAAPGAVEGLVDALAGQLDLQHVPVDAAVALYRNVASSPTRANGIDEAARAETEVAAMQRVDLTTAGAVLTDASGGVFRGPLPTADVVVHASSASDRWELDVGGWTASRTEAYGWANAFDTGFGGDGVLRYRTPLVSRLLLGAQATLWLMALALVVRMRFGSGTSPRRLATAGDAEDPGDGVLEAGAVPAAESTPEAEPVLVPIAGSGDGSPVGAPR